MTSEIRSDSLPIGCRVSAEEAGRAKIRQSKEFGRTNDPYRQDTAARARSYHSSSTRDTTVDRDSPRRETADAALNRARKLGSEQAEAFDLRLRSVEATEREERLAVAAWRPRMDKRAWSEEEDSLKVVQLEAQVSELTGYVKAVDESLPWRLIQNIRRLLGRAW